MKRAPGADGSDASMHAESGEAMFKRAEEAALAVLAKGELSRAKAARAKAGAGLLETVGLRKGVTDEQLANVARKRAEAALSRSEEDGAGKVMQVRKGRPSRSDEADGDAEPAKPKRARKNLKVELGLDEERGKRKGGRGGRKGGR